jgi:hypothetical protein
MQILNSKIIMTEFSSYDRFFNNVFRSSWSEYPIDNNFRLTKLKEAKVKSSKKSFNYKAIPREKKDEIVSAFRRENHLPYLARKFKGLAPQLRSALLKYCAYIHALEYSAVPKEYMEQIIYYGLIPDGAKIIKALRLKAFINLFNLEFLEIPEEIGKTGILFKDLPTIPVRIVSDILNPRFCIFYQEEIDDYKKGFEEISQDEKYLKRYERNIQDYIERYCPENLSISDPRIFYWSMTGSVCIDGSSKSKNFEVPRTYLESPKPLSGERVLIPICADNTRDAILLDINTLSYIQWINYEINKIFSLTPLYTFDSDPLRIKKRVNQFKEDFEFYICIDLEKEGITKPRNLIKLISSAIRNRYGDNKLSDAIDILFSSYNLTIRTKNYVKGKRQKDTLDEYFMQRGHGLGMANALTTVMQVGIVLTAFEEFQKDLNLYPEYGVLSFNDDLTIGLKEDYCREYAEYHFTVCQSLGHRMKRSKTFFGRQFVFCEEYSDEAYNNKSAYIKGFINSILHARNIVQAKQLLTSVDFTYVTRLTQDINRVMSKWGYEFYPKEFKAPIAFGGWWTKKMNGVDLTFSEYTPGIDAMWAYNACKIKHGDLTKVNHPLYEYLEEDLSIYIKERFFEPEEIDLYFDELYKKRQKAFSNQISKPLSIMFEEYRESSNIDVLPPESLSRWIDVDEAPYSLPRVGRPIENYYSHYGLIEQPKGCIKERFSYLYPKYEDRLISKPFNFKNLKLNYLITYANIDISEDLSSANYIYALDPEISLEEYYIDHTNVAMISMGVHPAKFGQIPIYKKLDKVKTKLDIWGRYPTSLDIGVIGLVKENPELYKVALTYGYEAISLALENIFKPEEPEITQVEQKENYIDDHSNFDFFRTNDNLQYLLKVLKQVPEMKKILKYDPISNWLYTGKNKKMFGCMQSIYPYVLIAEGGERGSFATEELKNRIRDSLTRVRGFLEQIEPYLKDTIWEIRSDFELKYLKISEDTINSIFRQSSLPSDDVFDPGEDNDFSLIDDFLNL